MGQTERTGFRNSRLRMQVSFGSILAIAVMFLFLLQTSWSQEAGLVGTVTDPSGAIVVGATISSRNIATGVERTATTDEAGRYRISPLAIGRYTLTVGAPGFRTTTVSDISLTIGQIGVMDVRMEVGEVTQNIEVSSTTTLLQAEQASVGQSVENKQIVDLPLDGRDFVQLVALTPGATVAGNAYETGNSQVLINGHRSTKTTSTIDGVLNVDQLFQGFPISPSIDAIEEFKVQSGNFSAEQGMGPSNVSVRLKSGTNQLHGSLFEFLRNDVFDARNFFQPEVSKLKRNQFGGTAGGPIKKEKLFWFGAYEGNRQRSGNDYSLTVPSAPMRSGNFSGMDPITDPLTGNPFPNNVIPADRINQTATYFTPFFPEPNSGTQYIYSPPSSVRADQASGRIDYYINNSNRFFGSYTFHQREIFDPDALPNDGGTLRRGRAQRLVMNWNHTFSPRTMNTATLGWARFRNVITPTVLGTNHTVLSGLQGFDQTSGQFPGFPSIGIGNYQGIYGYDWFPLVNPTTNWQINDDFSFIRGGHQFRVGTDLRRFIWYSQSATLSRGSLYYSGDYTGNGWADFLLGIPVYAFRQYPQSQYNQLSYNLGWYFQDDWRVTPNLTLNLGLRYEYDTWPVESRNQVTSFDPGSGKFAVGQEKGKDPDLTAQPLAPLAWQLFGSMMTRAEDVGLPNRSLRFPDKNNWGPRVGLAYRPVFLKETVFRAGYGVFYNLSNGNNNSDFTATSIPWIISQSSNNSLPTPTLDNQNLFVAIDTPGAATPNIQPIHFDPHARVPYVQEWNVAIQKQLNPKTSIEVAYVGNKGTKLETRVPFNRAAMGPGDLGPRRPFPDLSEGYAERNMAGSIYHAMQIKFERTFSSGLGMLASYTRSKSIDDASGDFGSGVQDINNLRLERGLSDFDYPQRFTVGYVWALPIGKGRRLLSSAQGAAQVLLGGWETSGIVVMQSGSPFTVYSGYDRANTGSWPQRPNRVSNGKIDNPTLDRWFDTNAFVLNDQYTWGNSSRNILRGDGMEGWDASVMKNFKIREAMNLQFRFELFNAFNHPDFGTPESTLSSDNFGKVFGTSNSPRIGQVALKLVF